MSRLLKRFWKCVPLIVVIAVIATPLTQSVKADPGGGVVIEGNFGGDVKTMNPILVQDSSSQRITFFLFPGLMGTDYSKGIIAPNVPGGLAKSWTLSPDGTTYTITLRDGLKWSDGTPITAQDIEFTWGAIADPKVGSYLYSAVYDPNGNPTGIKTVKATDDHTVVVTLGGADCTALNLIGSIPAMPSHLYKPDHSDMLDSPYNTNPSVSWGPFVFKEFIPSERVSLVSSADYPDALQGSVKPEGFIYKNITNQTVAVDQFLAGETNVFDTPPASRRADIAKKSDLVNIYDFPGDSFEHIDLNEDDPANPVPGLDSKGNVQPQGHHPLFGDVQVRRAMAMALDVPSIIKNAVNGAATQLPSQFVTTSWGHDPNLQPIPYDQVAAGKLLDAAGFPIGPDGKTRVAKGAKYAKDGTPLKFTLIYFSANVRRTKLAQIVKAELEQIGFQVDLAGMDFNTQIDTVNSEKYDAAIEVLGASYPDDPANDLLGLYEPQNDKPGSATNSNVTSYYNKDLLDLENKARTVPSCSIADRAPIYQQIDKILQDDVPYIPLYSLNGEFDALKTISGFDPKPGPAPFTLYWNIDTWTVKSPN